MLMLNALIELLSFLFVDQGIHSSTLLFIYALMLFNSIVQA